MTAQAGAAGGHGEGAMEFRKAEGVGYYRFLTELHRTHLFDWYMEIGCRLGRSFAPVRGPTIAVDPFFRIETNVIETKPELHIFQRTADDFFATGFLDRLGVRLSLSFLDGMHLFEYLLRDFLNTERRSRPDGVIALHDCCPFSHGMTTRDLENLPEGAWTGDVWKLIPILRDYRPDLTLTVLDCGPTGLVLVSGLAPDNVVLRDRYDEIVARFSDVSLEQYGLGAFYDLFDFVDARGFMDDGWPLFAHLRQDESLAQAPKWITP